MSTIRVTKEFSFEMAHALWNYDGACKNIHGHSYRLFVTVSGTPINEPSNPKFGMVIDFKDLKTIVKREIVDLLDHALIVFRSAEGESLDAVKKMYEKVHVFDFQPTCENLVSYTAEVLNKQLPENIRLHSVKLYETATSYAEWYAADN
ncbi:MAG: 6-pyruvoyl trahydropterin synthase family protein [Bacteroidota bacterium]